MRWLLLSLAPGLVWPLVGGVPRISQEPAPRSEPAAVPDGAPVWRTDLQAARAEAERDGRPLLVVFR